MREQQEEKWYFFSSYAADVINILKFSIISRDIFEKNESKLPQIIYEIFRDALKFSKFNILKNIFNKDII